MLAYSIKQAAKELGVCERLVRELVRDKKIRSVQIGRRIVIPHLELERLLAPPQDDPLPKTTLGETLLHEALSIEYPVQAFA